MVVLALLAGIAAVFSSPGVGMLYGIEVPFRRDVYRTVARLFAKFAGSATGHTVD